MFVVAPLKTRVEIIDSTRPAFLASPLADARGYGSRLRHLWWARRPMVTPSRSRLRKNGYPKNMEFPRLLPVRQHFPDHRIPDLRHAVQLELRESAFGSRLKPGAQVALGVGSRGIANIATIVRSTVDY